VYATSIANTTPLFNKNTYFKKSCVVNRLESIECAKKRVKLRRLPNMQEVNKIDDSKEVSQKKVGRFRTGLLMAGSALFGGIAVVLWNRRSLTKMQNQPNGQADQPQIVDEDAIY
jgi:hypothetical protein